MLRLLRHGDGTLALFNGMGFIAPDRLAALLAYDDVKAQALVNAPHSGYQRIECNGSILVIDAGRVPPRNVRRGRTPAASASNSRLPVKKSLRIAACPIRATPSRAGRRVSPPHIRPSPSTIRLHAILPEAKVSNFFHGQSLSGPLRVAMNASPCPTRTDPLGT